LIFCFEKKGVLTDVHDGQSVIHQLELKPATTIAGQGAFADGILPKLENAFSAIRLGVRSTHRGCDRLIKKYEGGDGGDADKG